MSRATTPLETSSVDAQLYSHIQHFYARHMQLADDGKVDEWAAKFTEDGIYSAFAHPEPAKGREQISTRMGNTLARLAATGATRRHWIGMTAVDRELENLRVRSYALVIESSPDVPPFLRACTTCEDVLVPDGTSWLIRERHIRGDTPVSLGR